MNTPLISIIIPVYNIEKYIRECILSICCQTYSNIEIIVVNDGSRDDSLKICEELAINDNRILILNKENGGLSSARNHGMKFINGEYVAFIDGDDIVAPNYIEKLYNLIKMNDCDVSICSFIEFNSIPPKHNGYNSAKILMPFQAIKYILENNTITTSAWGKLFHYNLVRNIDFPENLIYEDLPTIWKYINNSKKVAFTNNKLYYYRKNEQSITGKSFSDKNLDVITVHKILISDLQKDYPNLVKFAKARAGIFSADLLFMAISQRYTHNGDLYLLKKYIAQNVAQTILYGKPLRKKIAAVFFSLFPLNTCISIIRKFHSNKLL